jgi:hypothetical protein
VAAATGCGSAQLGVARRCNPRRGSRDPALQRVELSQVVLEMRDLAQKDVLNGSHAHTEDVAVAVRLVSTHACGGGGKERVRAANLPVEGVAEEAGLELPAGRVGAFEWRDERIVLRPHALERSIGPQGVIAQVSEHLEWPPGKLLGVAAEVPALRQPLVSCRCQHPGPVRL